MTTRLEVCHLTDIPEGGSKGFEIPGGTYDGFLVREGERVTAYLNTCPHQGHPLNWKPDAFLTRSGELIMCSVHGAIFEKGTGVCVGGPCVGKSLRTLEATVQDGVIAVTVG